MFSGSTKHSCIVVLFLVYIIFIVLFFILCIEHWRFNKRARFWVDIAWRSETTYGREYDDANSLLYSYITVGSYLLLTSF